MTKTTAALLLLATACGGSAPKPATTLPAGEPASPPPPAPAAPPALTFPDDAFRAKQPEPSSPLRAFQAPPISTFRLEDGLQVYLVEDHTLPLVWLSLTFDGGAALDPRGQEGTAGVCMQLLGEGTEQLDKVAFEEAQADHAVYVTTSATTDHMQVDVSAMTKNLDDALDLWAATLRHPGLRAADFERLKKERVGALAATRADPDAVSYRLLPSLSYGPKHAFARFATESSYAKVALPACRKLAASLGPDGARLFVAGDITREALVHQLGKRLAGWKGKAPARAKIERPAPRDGKVFFVDVPGAAQSILLFGAEAPPFAAPDHFATVLAGSILGGDFASRLNMELREEKGYTYGAHASFYYTRAGGLFYANAAVRGDATKDALADMFRVFSGMGTVTDEEIALNRNGAILAFPAGFATSSDVIGQYRELVHLGMPLDFYDGYVAAVQAVTKEQILTAAKARLVPEQIRILVVGDAKSQLAGVEALVQAGTFGGNRKLVRLDTDGNVVGK